MYSLYLLLLCFTWMCDVVCWLLVFFFSSRRRHTRCALVTGVQTCALPICARNGPCHLSRLDGALCLGAGADRPQSAHRLFRGACLLRDLAAAPDAAGPRHRRLLGDPQARRSEGTGAFRAHAGGRQSAGEVLADRTSTRLHSSP